MNRPAVVIPIVIIVNACMWGFAMVMASLKMGGVEGYEAVQGIMAVCAGTSLIVTGGGLAAVARRAKRSSEPGGQS